MLKRTLPVLIILLFAAVSTLVVFIGLEKINDKYGVNREIVEFLDSDRLNLLIEDELIGGYGPPVVSGSEIMLPFDVVKKYIDPEIYCEDDGSVVTITTEEKVIRMNSVTLESFVNMEPFEIDMSARKIDGIVYVPVVAFEDIFGISTRYSEKDSLVVVDFLKNRRLTGMAGPGIYYDGDNVDEMNEFAVIRSGMSIKHPLYRELSKTGEQVDVYSIKDGWARIRTGDGIVGFIENRFLEAKIEYEEVVVDLVREKTRDPETISLAWQYIHETTPPVDRFMDFPEINVYSPTWFTVNDASGDMESSADKSYVDKVHELGAQIWPLLKNTFNDIGMTSAVLNSPGARDNVIRQILSYSRIYGFEGINMDFENIYLKDRDAYTQLIKELMPYAREMGLTVSVDVGIPGGSDTYSLCYDHAALSKHADYIMVMTYDQHWGSSKVAGSQAQLSWVRDMIELTLEFVEPDKLVMGLPFYTRIWRENDGQAKNVRTTGIDSTLELVEEKAAIIRWDEESGQDYAFYEEEDGLYRMWIEDAKSLALKTELVHEYGLKGVAAWQLSLGNAEAWKSIGEVLQEGGR